MLNFICGMPRAGSTFLANLLAQNPEFHSSPSSGLVNIFLSASEGWRKNENNRAEGLEVVKTKLRTALKGILTGYYEEIKCEHVFDSNRQWLPHYEDVRWAMGEEPKMIACIRDVRESLASMEKLYRQRDGAHPYDADPAGYLQGFSCSGRMAKNISHTGLVGTGINCVRDALHKGLDILVVPYPVLMAEPLGVVEDICNFIGAEYNEEVYDPNNMKQLTHENDEYHGGLDLHSIKKKPKPHDPNDWREYFPNQSFLKEIEANYPDFLNGSELLPLKRTKMQRALIEKLQAV